MILKLLLHILLFIVVDKISCILLSKAYARKCNYNCDNCGMWSCTNGTDYENYVFLPYDNFRNVCGKDFKND